MTSHSVETEYSGLGIFQVGAAISLKAVHAIPEERQEAVSAGNREGLETAPFSPCGAHVFRERV